MTRSRRESSTRVGFPGAPLSNSELGAQRGGLDQPIAVRRVRPLVLELTFTRGDTCSPVRSLETRIHGLKRTAEGSDSTSPIAPGE